MNTGSNSSLIDRALNGDQSAFNSLLNRHWQEVYFFLLKRTANELDAEDIAIQTFSRAFEKLSSYDATFQFNTWLISISKNLHIDLIRARNRSRTEERFNADTELVLDDSPNHEDQLIHEQSQYELIEHIQKLHPRYRQLIELFYFESNSIREISAQLDESENNIKVSLLRARRSLAEILRNIP
ncbi:MAG: sigma-70 family RNA polymerase sigma factor [Bacteroidetes bacterium]|nr:sigma-70 family RNA polymerase sigma factor [Bacteroidota bacterium]